MKLFQKTLLILLICVSLLLTRFYFLDLIPATLSHDELIYSIEAYAYRALGTSLDGARTPFSLTPVSPMYAEWPASLMMFGFFITDHPLVASRLTAAVLGTILPFALGWLVYGIWQDRKAAYMAVVLATFNPLLWQSSRMSVDPFFSVIWYVIGAAILINLQSSKALFAIVPFTVGFFHYQGFKLELVPWIGLILALKFVPAVLSKQTSLKSFIRTPQVIVFIAGIALTFTYILFILPAQSTNNRLSSTIFTNATYLSDRVNLQRQSALDSPLTPLFINKLTVIAEFMLQRLTGSLSPHLFFISTNPAVSGYTVWNHGIWHLTEGLFLILGLIWLFRKDHIIRGVLVISSVVILNIPALINTMSEWYFIRGQLLYTFLLMIAALGVATLIKHKSWFSILSALYVINIAYFSYQYFHIYPVIAADAGNIDERIIAKYISITNQLPEQRSIVIVTNEPYYYFYAHLLYNKELSHSPQIQPAPHFGSDRDTYEYNNITFTSTCPQEIASDATYIISKDLMSCKRNLDKELLPNLTIPQVKDSGAQHFVYADVICQNSNLNSYISVRSYDQLKIESYQPDDFCRQWLTELQ